MQGRAIDPTSLSRTFTTLLRKADLRRIRFHDLCHSTATLLLERDVELVVIKELSGRAHLRLRLQCQAINTLSTALDGPAGHDPRRRRR
ncbi:integrase [Streptomyces auratus]|uniref:integrase n=1 Tax=Streptomyces auratus TaxID=114687 RepID=UPI0031BB879B